MDPRVRNRYVAWVLVGVFVLLLKHWLVRDTSTLIYSYLGNTSVSFAVTFLVILGSEGRLRPLPSAAIALAVVEMFEATDGFGIMTNVYDPFDYLANALGVAAAYGVALGLNRRIPAAQTS
jgi:hypothetical protein